MSPFKQFLQPQFSFLVLLQHHIRSTSSAPITENGVNLKDRTPIDDEDILPAGFWVFLAFIIMSMVLCIVRIIYLLLVELVIPHFKSIRLTNENPGEFDDEQLILEEDNRVLAELSPNEQELYFQAKDFIAVNPIDHTPLTPLQSSIIQERGISAWEFRPAALVVDEILVVNKTEINFAHANPQSELSVQTNLPMPKVLDVYYFESKIMAVPENSDDLLISIGISTAPYPYFRLPGRHRHSIAYDSNGDRRYNNLFPLQAGAGLCAFPKLSYADVIGIGYRTRTGTVFFTRNGKKVSESKIGGHISKFKHVKIYPIVGSNDKCSVHVNLGQSGFVFIEANVKKWGFAPLEGNGPPPPAYKTFNEDILLESSSEYSGGEESFPPNFWSATQGSFVEERDNDENITLNTLPQDPPLYHSGSDNEGEVEQADNAEEAGTESNSNGDTHTMRHLESIEGDSDVAEDDADGEDNSDQ